MSEDLGVYITGAREMGLRFERFPETLRADLVPVIGELTAETLAMVEALLPNRTGRLRGEMSMAVHDLPDAVTGVVGLPPGLGSGPDSVYAAAGALEYGAHGDYTVKAHAMRLDHLWARATGLPMTVDVPEHSRRLDLEARRFMRGPALAMRGRVFARLEDVVDRTVAEDM